MKLRDYRFNSMEDLNYVACMVLSYFAKDINPSDVDYTQIVTYKTKQLRSLLNGNFDITPEDLMMYLSCPIGVEDINNKTNFGIRTTEGSGNGKINMHLSKMILFRSLMHDDFQNILFDYEENDMDTLPCASDYLDVISPSLLKEPELLYYLFLTGRGEEFTRIFGDKDYLVQLEAGTFDGQEVLKRLSPARQGKSEASELLKDLVKKDELTIKALDDSQKEVSPVKTFS